MSSQQVLEQLGDALMMVLEAWKGVLGLLDLSWEILLGVTMVVFTVKNRQTLRRGGKLVGKYFTSIGICGKVKGKTELTTKVREASQSPEAEDCVPMLQGLCFKALDNVTSPPINNTGDFLDIVRQECESFPFSLQEPKMAHLPGQTWAHEEMSNTQVTKAKRLLEIAKKNVKDLQRKAQASLNENIPLQQNLEWLFQAEVGWMRSMLELLKQGSSLESSNRQTVQILKDKVNELNALAQTILKTIFPPDIMEVHDWEEEEMRAAGGSHVPADVKTLLVNPDLETSSKNYEEKRREIARQLHEENQINEALLGQIEILQSEQASLQSENCQLTSEIEKLRLKLQELPEQQLKLEKQLQRKSAEEETQKKVSKVSQNVKHIHRQLNHYKQLLRNLGTELEKATHFYQKEVAYQERRAYEAWLDAWWSEGELQALRKENDQLRQVLANVQYKPRSFQSGIFGPKMPLAVHRGLAGPGVLCAVRPRPQKHGHLGKAKESRAT